MSMLFLMKPTSWGLSLQKFIKEKVKDYLIVTGDWGDPIPDSVFEWEGDYIFSFVCPWILPEKVLNNAKKAGINFHPATPEYPGIGCYNYAIYDGVKEYGAMCHIMAPKVDSGPIIKVKRFPLYGNESVEVLKERTMTYMVELFYEIMDIILNNKELPQSDEKWLRTAYTRKDFQELCKLNINMSEEELAKRMRATYFAGALDYPNIVIGGKKYLLVDPTELDRE